MIFGQDFRWDLLKMEPKQLVVEVSNLMMDIGLGIGLWARMGKVNLEITNFEGFSIKMTFGWEIYTM